MGRACCRELGVDGGSVGKDGDNNQGNRGTSNSTNIFTYSSLLNNTRLNCMGPFTDRFFFFPQEIRYYTICNLLSPGTQNHR